jgi:putative endonuclease
VFQNHAGIILVMAYFVYIVANTVDDELYKGYSEDPYRRIEEHNAGKSPFTATKSGWFLVFIKQFLNKKDALIFEKKIKRLNRRSLLKLINSDENILGSSSVG